MGEYQGSGTGIPPAGGRGSMDETGYGARPVAHEPRPTGEMEAIGEVYADVASARWLIPLFGAIVGLGLVVLLVVQLTGTPGGGGGSDDAATEGDDTDQSGDDLTSSGLGPEEMAQAAALRFEDALNGQSLSRMDFAFDDPAEAQAEFTAIWSDLDNVDFAVDIETVVLPEDEIRTSVPVETTWTLTNVAVAPPLNPDGQVAESGAVDLQGGTATFTTNGVVDVVQVGTEWQVDWSPTVIDERLLPGDTLVFDRVPADRAPILGAGGFELIGERPAISIGVIPRQATSLDAVGAALARLFELDEAALIDNLGRSPSDDIFAVAVQRPEDIEQIRGELLSTPGVVLSETSAILPPTSGFARGLLGRTGEATAELIDNNPDQFARGDIVGRSGLQAAYNEQLSGYPGWQIRIDRRFPLADDQGQQLPPDDPANILALTEPTAGTPIQTTIDEAIQQAADRVVAQTQQPSSLVAIRASTGEVLAVANGPANTTDNFALTGQYPPGSVFKIITAYAALEQGFTADNEIDCPPTVEVDGREFRNSNFQGFGRVSFRDAFAYSCNTSFIQIGLGIDRNQLPSTARRFGVGAEYGLGTSAFSGSVPTPGNSVDQAATAFGQGQVLASPLSMAVMSATAASGVYFTPQLVLDGDVVEPQAIDRLDEQAANQLRDLMGAVVDYGTGGAARGVPGERVLAKTGTAQFGTGDPPATHAWFTGFQGDVAFAVLVEGGGAGGSVAGPIAAEFLRQIAQQ